MSPERVISVDIGSTFTKGAVFGVGAEPAVLRRAWHATTQNDLALGFAAVLAELCGREAGTPLAALEPGVPVHISSSAKGGLSIAVVGLVPDLTLSLARRAAMSAGGRIARCFAYALTAEDVASIRRERPDILLLSGGTDGGNTSYVVANAERIAASDLDLPILYAGNRAAAERVVAILRDRPVTVVPNLMPELHEANLEPARATIRELFLRTIIDGKGLGVLASQFGATIRPTPLGVYELIGAIPQVRPDFADLCAIDLGGATTDFYSNTQGRTESGSVIVKGLPEPQLKRTVEGDLGMRVSAAAVLDSAAGYLAGAAPRAGLCDADLRAVVATWAACPGTLGTSPQERAIDTVLAEACVHHAALRHAGRLHETFTPQGRVHLQSGKDLRAVRHVIGAGGYLSACTDDGILRRAFAGLAGADHDRVLAPEQATFHADSLNLFPLLGNLAAAYPHAAVELALRHLSPLEPEPQQYAHQP